MGPPRLDPPTQYPRCTPRLGPVPYPHSTPSSTPAAPAHRAQVRTPAAREQTWRVRVCLCVPAFVSACLCVRVQPRPLVALLPGYCVGTVRVLCGYCGGTEGYSGALVGLRAGSSRCCRARSSAARSSCCASKPVTPEYPEHPVLAYIESPECPEYLYGGASDR